MLANRNIVEIGLRGCKHRYSGNQVRLVRYIGLNAATSVARGTTGPTGKRISYRSQMMGCCDFISLITFIVT